MARRRGHLDQGRRSGNGGVHVINVIQRVRSASVTVGERTIGNIESGLVILAAIEKGDQRIAIEKCARKIASLRIFSDSEGRMNLSIGEAEGSILAISQFTLAGSIRKGRRPSFERAEEPERARELFDHFVESLRAENLTVETGEFGAMMVVSLDNDGPVTFIQNSSEVS